MLFARCFINNMKRSINIRAHFMLCFKQRLDKKGLGKSADVYKNRKKEDFDFEQNPMKSESPLQVLHGKQEKNVKAEATMFEKKFEHVLE